MTDASSVADTINSALQDPIPRIIEAPNTSTELLLGLNGEKLATVREMTGSDEEYLSSLEAKGALSYAEYMSYLLKKTVVSIGDIEVKNNPEIIDQLIIGDRDILFLAVVKATYGKTRTFNIKCGECRGDVDINVDLDEDFSVEGTPEDAAKKISVELKNGEIVTFRLPNGGDSRYVAKKGKTSAESNTLMMARCAELPMDAGSKERWARDLNIGDRTKIVNALLGVKIGPKPAEVNDPCPHCGETISMVIDWVGLLFG